MLAVATGHGCDWAAVGSGNTELTLRLVRDVPIRGRILDREGRPVAGAKVRVLSVTAYEGEDLSKMLENFRRVGWQTSHGVKHWAGPLPGQASVVTVGADGRFRLAGFGRERTVTLNVEGPGIEFTSITLMTRHDKAITGSKPLEGYRQSKFYPATFDYLAAPARPIRGVVRDKVSGKPVAGVTVWSFLTTHRPVTDAGGRYELLGHPKAPTYALHLEPPDGRHFRFQTKFSDSPGLAPLAADLALPSGILARGRVLDKASGKPVPGIRVSYHVLFPNPKAGRLNDYEEYEGISAATSARDGSFALSVLPGPGVLAAAADPLSSYQCALVTLKELEACLKEKPHRFNSEDNLIILGAGALANTAFATLSQRRYNALALINPNEKDTSLACDLVLLPPVTRKGTVVGPDGKPLLGVTAIGVSGDIGLDGVLKAYDFTVRGLHPKRTRELFFYHKEKNLGRYVELRGEQSEPLKVELQPCGSVAGRLIEKAGKPVAGTVIYVCRRGNGPFWPGGLQVKTDQDGRFLVEGLVPGQP